MTAADTRLADAAAQLEQARRWAVSLENECARLNAELEEERTENAGLRRQLAAIGDAEHQEAA